MVIDLFEEKEKRRIDVAYSNCRRLVKAENLTQRKKKLRSCLSLMAKRVGWLSMSMS